MAGMKTKDVIRHFGGIAQTARAIGYTRQGVYKWGRTVPERAQFLIQVVTGGKFKAKDPRPRLTA